MISNLPLRDAVALKILCAWLTNPEVFWDNDEIDHAPNYEQMSKNALMAADAFLSAAQSAPGHPRLPIDIDDLAGHLLDGEEINFKKPTKQPQKKAIKRKKGGA